MYQSIIAQLKSLTEDNPYWISNLANAAALLYDSLHQINWAGFYIMQDGKLILGPFQGKIIKIGNYSVFWILTVP